MTVSMNAFKLYWDILRDLAKQAGLDLLITVVLSQWDCVCTWADGPHPHLTIIVPHLITT